MSRWTIAAAQYAPRHNCVDEHVKHHLHFIAEAASHGCDLVVFPELSLTGPGGTTLPPPPDDLQLAPLLHAAQSRFITVIAGITLQQQKGLALFTPNLSTIRRYPQGNGAGVIPGNKRLTIVDNQADAPELDPEATLAAIHQFVTTFAHKYAIAVLMANARSGSALWDEKGQLIVRADKGELLLTGSLGRQGWQGDIIPLG